MRSIIRRRFWNTLQWSNQILMILCNNSYCQWNILKVISVSSKTCAQQNNSKNKVYTCWYVYKQCQKQCRLGQIHFCVFHPYTIAISLQVNCISYEKKFTRNIHEKNVHFNIVSGHFELMSISNYDDYQPRLIIPKLNLFFLRLSIGYKSVKSLFVMSSENIYYFLFLKWNSNKCYRKHSIHFIFYILIYIYYIIILNTNLNTRSTIIKNLFTNERSK